MDILKDKHFDPFAPPESTALMKELPGSGGVGITFRGQLFEKQLCFPVQRVA